jgi:cellulose synthase/poly-beta-1,6-N-acetylglucosamine synthase-like glycosyltransferase
MNDAQVFPDSLTRMVSCMVHDEEIMGLCGETKIANKAETFVTMMQGAFPPSSSFTSLTPPQFSNTTSHTT